MPETAKIPAIDISDFLGGDADGRRRVAQAVARACEEIGFLVISGHGVPQPRFAFESLLDGDPGDRGSGRMGRGEAAHPFGVQAKVVG